MDPGVLVVLVGVSGAGKSTYARRYPASWRLCLDEYRQLATDDAADQSATPTAADVEALLLAARLVRGLPCVVDSTNVQPCRRAELLARARYYQRPVQAVLFDLPLQLCQERNAARSRKVPGGVLRRQHQQLPTADMLRFEGFADVRTITHTTHVGDFAAHVRAG